jgi:transcriptional regulator with XRE-family HTH domain
MLPEHNNTNADQLVSKNIRMRRHARGLSTGELSLVLGRHCRNLAAIESGAMRPSAITLLTLAKTLDCRLSDFFVEP